MRSSNPPRWQQALYCLVFVLGLLLLREGIVWLRGDVGTFRDQARWIKAGELDPAALFYTEIPQALRAARDTRRRLRERTD